MTCLDVPVPPQLELALGVPDAGGLHVGLFWGTTGEPRYTDGRLCGSCWQDAFLLFEGHPAVHPGLAAYGLGPSDRMADHWLLLDRVRSRLDVAPAGRAKRFLHFLFPPWVPFVVIGQQDEGISSSPPEPLAAAVREMLAWLDGLRPGQVSV
ncbi:MAG: hypothetical protein JWO38_7382 [Gemmataceae bacterium]|nr:hypothetical protein [Gemmataceae bacterium]